MASSLLKAELFYDTPNCLQVSLPLCISAGLIISCRDAIASISRKLASVEAKAGVVVYTTEGRIEWPDPEYFLPDISGKRARGKGGGQMPDISGISGRRSWPPPPYKRSSLTRD